MFRKILKDKRGMTVLEVLVAFTVSLIILGAAFALFVPSLKSFSYNSRLGDAKNTSALIVDKIQEKVQFSKSVEIKNGLVTASKAVYQDTDGTIMFKASGSSVGNDMVPKAFFNDKLVYSVTYTTATDIPSGLEVNIVVTEVGKTKPIYSMTSTIPILNNRDGKGSFTNSVPELTPGVQEPGTYLVFS